MNVDSSYFLDQKVNAYVQTLGLTGVERSTGSPITIGGVLSPQFDTLASSQRLSEQCGLN